MTVDRKQLEPVAALEACRAAIRYDEAIQAAANNPEKMSSFTTATGEDLDDLYEDWISKSHAALEGGMPQETRPDSAQADATDAARYRAIVGTLYRKNIEVGEALLMLKVIGGCPTVAQFHAAIDAIRPATKKREKQ